MANASDRPDDHGFRSPGEWLRAVMVVEAGGAADPRLRGPIPPLGFRPPADDEVATPADPPEPERPPRDVTVLDVVIGKTRTVRDERFDPFQWAENNYSCDCNRGDHFHYPDGEEPESSERYCDGHHRYVVVAIDPWPAGSYTLDEYNDGYPEAAQEAARRWQSLTAEERLAMRQESEPDPEE
jgi:hypothetical protein